METTQDFGIRSLVKASNSCKVQCKGCGLVYYEDITDERNMNSLCQLFDVETQEYFLGCPKCETDEFLLNFADLEGTNPRKSG